MMMPARVALALQADGAADLKAMRAISRVRDELVDAYDGGPLPDKVLTVMERLGSEYAEAKGDAWWLRSEIIWAKPNPMPESCDRPTDLLTREAVSAEQEPHDISMMLRRCGWPRP